MDDLGDLEEGDEKTFLFLLLHNFACLLFCFCRVNTFLPDPMSRPAGESQTPRRRDDSDSDSDSESESPHQA